MGPGPTLFPINLHRLPLHQADIFDIGNWMEPCVHMLALQMDISFWYAGTQCLKRKRSVDIKKMTLDLWQAKWTNCLSKKKSINSSAPAARARPYEGLKEFTIFIEKDFVPHFVQVFRGLRTDSEWNISKMGRVILKCEEWKSVPPPAAICDLFFSKQGNSEKNAFNHQSNAASVQGFSFNFKMNKGAPNSFKTHSSNPKRYTKINNMFLEKLFRTHIVCLISCLMQEKISNQVLTLQQHG